MAKGKMRLKDRKSPTIISSKPKVVPPLKDVPELGKKRELETEQPSFFLTERSVMV